MPNAARMTPEQLLATHCAGLQPTILDLDAGAACVLLAQLQLALRHPGNRGYSADIARRIADDLIAYLAAGDPTIEMLLRRGDNPTYDAPTQRQ